MLPTYLAPQPLDPTPILTHIDDKEKELCRLQVGFGKRLRNSPYCLAEQTRSSCSSKTGRKKARVDWASLGVEGEGEEVDNGERDSQEGEDDEVEEAEDYDEENDDNDYELNYFDNGEEDNDDDLGDGGAGGGDQGDGELRQKTREQWLIFEIRGVRLIG
ncbi:hypothetical protein FRB99_003096 [Tulasnella sp. 403]|nr:hypothetical protein FRB99_003096 [Tulasnella sp. 403]